MIYQSGVLFSHAFRLRDFKTRKEQFIVKHIKCLYIEIFLICLEIVPSANLLVAAVRLLLMRELE